MTAARLSWVRLAAAVVFLVIAAAAFWLLEASGLLAVVLDGPALRARVEALGAWGPLLIVALMTVAVVISPIPSAPIAVAAGAAYGHVWGTLYVVAGAEAGACVAFGVARLVGPDALRRWFGDRLPVAWLEAQNALMGVVFVSRLLPFLSFDLVSYAAGLTALRFWRFGLATLAGIIPASFLLAHFGGEMTSGDTTRIVITVVLLGAIVLVPFAFQGVRKLIERRRRARDDSGGD